MPSVQRVEDFIAMVVNERHVDAINDFYHEAASMQENLNPPRIGKDHLIAHEKESHSKFKSMESFPPKSVLIDGDQVVIQWAFEIIDLIGQRRRLEEVSLQRWRGIKLLKNSFSMTQQKPGIP